MLMEAIVKLALTWQIDWRDRQVAVFAGLMTCLIRNGLNPQPKLKAQDRQQRLFVLADRCQRYAYVVPNLTCATLLDPQRQLHDRGFEGLL